MNQSQKPQGLIFVISGPSGSGKTTLAAHLLKTKGLKGRLVKPVSFTTRPKRSGERQGKDYSFVTPDEFKEGRRAKKFLEWTKYLGYYYATPREFIKRSAALGMNVALCLDIKGAFRIKRIYPKNTVMIFVAPPSLGALRERITNRCNRTHKDEVRERLKLAKEELQNKHRYDYYLVNKDLPHTVGKLKKIILKELVAKL